MMVLDLKVFTLDLGKNNTLIINFGTKKSAVKIGNLVVFLGIALLLLSVLIPSIMFPIQIFSIIIILAGKLVFGADYPKT